MASLGPAASVGEIEDELDFVNILIETLDPEADEYAQNYEKHMSTKISLEQRLAALTQTASPMPQMDGRSGQNEFWRTTLGGRPPSRHSDSSLHDGLSSSGLKRVADHENPGVGDHRSKRQTPDPARVSTPSSSNNSFVMVERPRASYSEGARIRHAQAEAAFERQRVAQRADEQLARTLSQQQSASRPSSAIASSSGRPNVQTTLGFNGAVQRPPPVKSESQIKSEPSNPQPGERARPTRAVVDLTGLDDDDSDSDISEIAPENFTPSGRQSQPYSHAPAPPAYVSPYGGPVFTSGQQGRMGSAQPGRPQYSMPGAWPGMQPPPPSYGTMQQYPSRNVQSGLYIPSANIRSGTSSASGQLSELNYLVNGQNASRNAYSIGDDDDLVYGGTQPRSDPLSSLYAGQEDLYRDRYEAYAGHDPTKTKEEIEALLANIRPDEELPAHLRVQTPEGMAIKLKKYQELGLTWLKKCEEGTNKGGILADDMGLGKTIQMLSLMVSRRSEDPRCKTTLIIAPVALMRQWKEEIATRIKPLHALSVYVHHGQAKKKRFADLRMFDVVLTTYGSIAAELKKAEAFELRRRNDPDAQPYDKERCALLGEECRWYRVVLDEAQCIKNRNTKTAKAAYRLNAQYRFCMSGTPMMNNVEELHSLIHFLRIRPYCRWDKFRMDIVQGLKNARTRDKAMSMLQTLCKAVMLRRTKKSTFEGQPILVLPERVTEVDNPQFNEHEQDFYQALEQKTTLQFNKYFAAGTVGKNYSAILVLLLRLRQACCHPHLVKDFGVATAADLSQDDLVTFAESLDQNVVARIKEKEGNFECPVCYDATTNPAIFIPCGHDTCSDCFARLTDPSNAVADGNENAPGGKGKCPECRGEIDSKKVTDFDSFKKVHQRDLLTVEERNQESVDEEAAADSDDSSDSDDDDSEDGDDADERGNLRGFIVDDEDDEAEGSETEVEEGNDNAGEGPSTASRQKAKAKNSQRALKKSKKAKGKEKKKEAKAVTLADLKKMATRNKKFKKAYLKKLEKDWVSSAKIEKTLEIVQTLMQAPEGEKILIFSQWTSLLDLLEVPIHRAGHGYVRYDGSMNPSERADAVDNFRDHRKNIRIMLVSLKAGNAGLNLNMASQVIILDPFWNPFIEEQAIDRAHRLGQERPVKVHRVLIEGTVEDRIIAIQERKRELIGQALDENASANIGRLGVRELAYLFGVTNNPSQAVQYRPQEPQRRR
ncbi:zinc finger protein, C3HC4 type (RING finger) [Teratosphaeria destructans]|uniref:Zinc finger protein, C3HC4 type (RING finger) n=1 Tax=Teratosphaeria destructans TaxID=418781 RepID=A0A9W7SWQ6_9PEZI|nr:zinc finger protein, C3HC4 type (RING finger) [Teratosphaeria destructans]